MGEDSNVHVIVAGAAAAFTVDLLIYPLDTLKTRLQAPPSLHGPALRFRGLYQGVGSVIIATLPAGFVSPFFGCPPPNSLSWAFFTVYESTKSLLKSTTTRAAGRLPDTVIHATASSVAELASCLILTPAEVIKQNAQVLRQSSATTTATASSTSLQAFRSLKQGGGGLGKRLVSGYTALVARNLPFTAIHFPAFEATRSHLWRWRRERRREGQDRGLWETGVVTGVSAGLSGCLAAAVTTPMDVVKTRMMLMAADKNDTKNSGGLAGKESGFDIAKRIWGENGVLGLFRGGLFRGIWTAMGAGLYLGTYEVSKLWLSMDGRGVVEARM